MAALPSAADDERLFPVRLVIPASEGGVTFDHFLHAQRVKFDCAVCHASLWPKDSTSSLGFSAFGHRTAETNKAGCANCHRAGGCAFASEGNCTNRCHAKYAGDGNRLNPHR